MDVLLQVLPAGRKFLLHCLFRDHPLEWIYYQSPLMIRDNERSVGTRHSRYSDLSSSSCILYFLILYFIYIYVSGQFYLHQSFSLYIYLYVFHYFIVMKSLLITYHVSTENIICANKNCMTLSLIHMKILLEIIVLMIIMIHSNKSMNLQI